MSRLVPSSDYATQSSVYYPEIGALMPVETSTPMLSPPDRPQQQQQQDSTGFGNWRQLMEMAGGSGGGAGVTPAMAAGAGPGSSAMYTPGVAGAMPTGMGGGSVAGGMSVPGMSAGTPAAGGGSGALGSLGAVAWPAAIAAAVGAAGHYQEKQGINTWGEHLTDFGGSHVRHGDELNRLSGKWLGEDSYVGDNLGKMLRGPMRISSLRPREMWGGFKDTMAPITSIADLWS